MNKAIEISIVTFEIYSKLPILEVEKYILFKMNLLFNFTAFLSRNMKGKGMRKRKGMVKARPHYLMVTCMMACMSMVKGMVR